MAHLSISSRQQRVSVKSSNTRQATYTIDLENSKIKFNESVPDLVGNVGKEVGSNRQHQLDIDRIHHQQLQDVHGSESGDLVPVRLLPSHLTESIQLGDEAQLIQMEGLFSQSHAGMYPLHVTVTYHHHATVEVFKGKHLLINHIWKLNPWAMNRSRRLMLLFTHIGPI